MVGVTYDSGALIAAERNVRSMWALHRRALERGLLPVVPTCVQAQVWREGSQPQVSRLLAGCEHEPLYVPGARAAGELCGIAGTSDIVDAVVVTGAARRGDRVVTSDTGDLQRLRDALGARVRFLTPG